MASSAVIHNYKLATNLLQTKLYLMMYFVKVLQIFVDLLNEVYFML